VPGTERQDLRHDLRGDASVLLPPGPVSRSATASTAPWSKGFEVAAVEDGGYRVLRCSDRTLLPRTFSDDEVRRTRKGASMWWV
jgi:hypothetical protein